MNQLGDRFFGVMGAATEGVRGVCAELHDQGISSSIRPWFKMAYHVIRASVPLFEFCLHHLKTRPPDHMTEKLVEFYRHKIEEEDGHDRLMASDIAHLGMTPELLEQELPPTSIVALVGSQYYLIAHHHPAVFLGYLGFLEGFPPSAHELSELAAKSDVPAESWKTVKLHVELDPWHRDEIASFMNELGAPDSLQRAIIANGIRTGEHYCQALEGLLSRKE
jgi:hypothetical protein